MKNKTGIYRAYYLILAAMLLGQVIFTLYQSGLVVAHSHQHQSYQEEKLSLIAKKQQLATQLAQLHSLTISSQNQQLAEFQPILQPIVIDFSTNLASLN